jgi:hypothetical protein
MLFQSDISHAGKMKARRKTQKRTATPRTFEFFQRRPENVLRVEPHEAGVRIQAARDNFSARDKAFFVRYLAAEGFIPEDCRWSTEASSSCLTWETENFSLNDSHGSRAGCHARPFMIRLLACASVLWLIELTFLFFQGCRGNTDQENLLFLSGQVTSPSLVNGPEPSPPVDFRPDCEWPD